MRWRIIPSPLEGLRREADRRGAHAKHGRVRGKAAFAARFGFSVKNIQNWEQGSRQPEGPARAYLLVIDRNPKAVQEALSKAS
jgi:putative transcriptional regulator